LIAVIMAPLLGVIDQAFQFIQEYGVVSPGILAVFILGLFWKKHLIRLHLGRITFYSYCNVFLSRTKIMGCGKWF
jgi:hypothetical protein